MLLKLGGQVLSGLSGNIAIPKQTGSATAYWIAEGAATTASDLALGMLELSPKTVSAKSGYTRNMLLQGNPSVEALVMNDLAAAIALAIDSAGFAGTGANGQPLGILNTTGIGAVDCATASGGLTNSSVIDLETSIASGNADVNNMNYVAGAVVTGKLKKKAVEAGHPAKLLANGEVNGYKHNRTNQIPANTIIFGDFSQVITALWGGLDIMIDQYSNADTGGVVVRAFQSVDVGVRYPEAFSATTNIDQ
jgi:HK97 family phage major capsid protein